MQLLFNQTWGDISLHKTNFNNIEVEKRTWNNRIWRGSKYTSSKLWRESNKLHIFMVLIITFCFFSYTLINTKYFTFRGNPTAQMHKLIPSLSHTHTHPPPLHLLHLYCTLWSFISIHNVNMPILVTINAHPLCLKFRRKKKKKQKKEEN